MSAENLHKFSEQLLGAVFEYSKLAISSLILLNGAGATAVLAFIGTHSTLGHAAALTLACFATGAGCGGIASVFAYFGQRHNWELVTERRADDVTATNKALAAAYLLVVSGYALYVLGCIAGGMALGLTR